MIHILFSFLFIGMELSYAADSFDELAKQCGNSKDFHEKIQFCTQALTSWGIEDGYVNKGEVYLERALAYMVIGKLEPALADADNAVNIIPHSWQTHNARGEILAKLNRCKEALSEYNEAFQGIHPTDHVNRSYLLYKRGVMWRDCAKSYEEAIKNFEAAIVESSKIKDTESVAWAAMGRGVTKCKQKQYAEGLKNIAHAIEILSNLHFHYEMGICQQAKGNLVAAAKSYSEVIRRTKPKRPHETYVSKEFGTTTVGVSTEEELIDSYYRRAQVNEKMRKHKLASKDYLKACQMGLNQACK